MPRSSDLDERATLKPVVPSHGLKVSMFVIKLLIIIMLMA